MEIKTIRLTQQNAVNLINNKQLKEAITTIKPLVYEASSGELKDQFENLEFTYKNLLKYLAKGINDPQRNIIYNKVITDLYHITDNATENLLTKHSSEQVYDTKRELAHTLPIQVSSILEKVLSIGEQGYLNSDNYNNNLAELFNSIWLNDNWGELEIKMLQNFFRSENVSWHTKALITGAILFSLLRIWNDKLASFLINLTNHNDNRIKMRALTNTILILQKYDARLPYYTEITNQLKLLSDNSAWTQKCQAVMIQLFRTRETVKISEKLQNEILPEVIKMQSTIKQKLDIESLTAESLDEKNPEWGEIFADSPQLLNKLEELSKLQLEGADVFLNTFQTLKHFPFFNNVHNWILPFFAEHPQIIKAMNESGDTLKNSTLFENISKSSFLCNSDKYSLFLGIPHMPSMQQQMLGQMFKSELEQLNEIESDEALLNPDKQDLGISNQYIQDLYRFYKIHPQKHQFEDLFSYKMDFYRCWFFKQLIYKPIQIRELAEYLFNKNYHSESLEIMNELLANDTENIELMQKIAFCHHQLKNTKTALSYFLKADLLSPNKLWTIKKIARCYADLKDFNKALEYYTIAEKLDENNQQTQAAIGHCLIETQQYNQALQYFFKLDYLNPNNTKTWRPIAWCSFIEGKLDQAEKYYHKLLVINQTPVDLIGLGHVNLCKGNITEALFNYRDSIKLDNSNIVEFLKNMKQEEAYLEKNGILPSDLPLYLDQVKYLLEE